MKLPVRGRAAAKSEGKMSGHGIASVPMTPHGRKWTRVQAEGPAQPISSRHPAQPALRVMGRFRS